MATILVVDDLPTNREFLVALLGYAAHEVMEAADGVLALHMMRDRRPDLVIADVRMPTMDGYELVKRMRADPLLARTPVVFYTAGSYERESRALAESCGVSHILIKPSEPQLILQTVNAVLGAAPSLALAESIEEFDRVFLDLPIDSIDPDAIVFVVDDDTAMRRKVIALMESASLRVRGYAAAEEFLKHCNFEAPGCLVLDIRMPGMSGVELLETLRSRGIEMPAIVLTGHGNVSIAVRSLKLGVLDFLEKPANPRLLLAKTLQALREDGSQRRQRREIEPIRKRFATLSPREMTLLKLVVAGRSNKEIALDLEISAKTVANHRMNLMSKTDARNGPDLVRMSVMAGM